VGQTVAGLSHTIKNIASGLNGGAFVLEKGFELEKMTYLHQGWEMVKGNVDKIAKLSLDLLNYAKTAEINYEVCDPNQPVMEVVEILTPKADEFNIHLTMDLISDPRPFPFDPEGIHRCLFNLVDNAIDACKEDAAGNSQKQITVRTYSVEDWEIVYEVKDNGHGIDDETRQKLFQYFFTTKGNQGNGIGLMMIKNIVEKHNGMIDVWSEKNIGSSFTIKLPHPENQRS
jgi:signal transduction histidine kinase